MELSKDIQDTGEGDVLIENGDLRVASIKQSIKQNIDKRLQTNNPDWFRHFEIGADIEDLKGEDNTKQTARIGEEKIKRALTHDNMIDEGKLNVRGVPTNSYEITFYIMVDIGINETLTVVFPVDIS